MTTWHENAEATAAAGRPTIELDHPTRRAMANITELDDGTSVLSISIVLRGDQDVRGVGEQLLEELGNRAVRL